MRYASLFAGIGGFDLGFERAGMVCAWQAELDKAAATVLARHWPKVKRYRHVESINYRTGKAYRRYFKPAAVDVICGGFPCQDVSLAGKRAGLAGKRSGLWFEFHRILAQHRPAWTVIENVPGLLSSNGGRDFAIILRGLVELGYGVAWRVLNAQYFGVAQRRRRVFIVGHLGDGRAAEVLFESESGDRDFAPRRETGARTATDVAASIRATGGGERGFSFDAEQGLVAATLNSGGNSGGFRTEPGEHLVAFGGNNTQGPIDVATAQNAHGGTGRLDFESETFLVAHETGQGFWTEGLPGLRANPGGMPENIVAHTLRGEGHDASEDGTGRGTPLVFAQNTRNEVRLVNGDGAIAGALAAEPGMHQQNFLAYNAYQNTVSPVHSPLTSEAKGRGETGVVAITSKGNGEAYLSEQAPSLSVGGGMPGQGYSAAMTTAGVRRLTPVECERLQGFPDGWTAAGVDGPQADSARYKQLGNAVAVPCAEWIGRRIMQVVNQEA